MGFMAGLFGIGGGVILVPFLTFLFEGLGRSMTLSSQMAVATSLACILFTAPISIYTHHKKNGVDWSTIRITLPGILVGASIGTYLVSTSSGFFLRLSFLSLQVILATWFLFGQQPIAHTEKISHWKIFLAGCLIAFLSSLLGIGGGVFYMSFLVWHGYSIQRAIGTSSAIGFPIAFFAVLGFIFSGFHQSSLQNYHLGYIYLPAIPGILLTSIFCARLGARLTHKLDSRKLKKIFAVFLYLLALKIAWSLW